MADAVLTLRDLNRATLDRQFLLERTAASATDVVERLAGMQAQQASAPYVGLWTRIAAFEREHLAAAIRAREIVKATYLRATLHLVTTRDYLRFRRTLEPMLQSAWSTNATRRDGGLVDLDELLPAAHEFLRNGPMTFAAISSWVAETFPDKDVGSLRYAIRTHIPLVQVPIDRGWSYPGNPEFALASSWLDAEIDDDERLDELVLRYLAAFGPATPADAQSWSFIPKLADTFARLGDRVVRLRDDRKRTLYDVAGLERPNGNAPAPVRFLPEYDNILLSHKDRTRIIADEYRKLVYLPGLRVRATFLVDGFVAGGWKVEAAKRVATLTLEPFAKLAKPARSALVDEAERLVRFVEPDAKTHAVVVAT